MDCQMLFPNGVAISNLVASGQKESWYLKIMDAFSWIIFGKWISEAKIAGRNLVGSPFLLWPFGLINSREVRVEDLKGSREALAVNNIGCLVSTQLHTGSDRSKAKFEAPEIGSSTPRKITCWSGDRGKSWKKCYKACITIVWGTWAWIGLVIIPCINLHFTVGSIIESELCRCLLHGAKSKKCDKCK